MDFKRGDKYKIPSGQIQITEVGLLVVTSKYLGPKTFDDYSGQIIFAKVDLDALIKATAQDEKKFIVK